MQSSRGTPTPPSSSRLGRPLTQEVIQQYRQLFEAARQHRPVSPTLPPSPPASSSAETGPSPASSESSGKRKHDETSSGESVLPPSKRSRHLVNYHVPTHTRRGPPPNPKDISTAHMQRATGFKRRADKDQNTMQSAAGANLYALSILNFAFAYRLEGNMGWRSLHPMLNVMHDRFSKLSKREPSPKLDAWMSYLQLLRSAVDLQQDQDHITALRKQIDKQADEHQKRAQQPLESFQSQSSVSATSSAQGASTEATSIPSLPGTPLLRAPTPKGSPEGHFTLNWEDARALSSMLSRARNGPHNREGRRHVLKHLNPMVLRTHFPRTFMRAFGEDGFGHVSNPEDSSSPGTADQKGPLNVWEEYEIWDLEANEQEGGDFPYPHHPDDIFWVIILGRSMLTDLALPESL